MRRPDQHGHSKAWSSLAAWLPVLAALGIMVTGCLSTLLVLQLDAFRPKLGDIVTFQPASQDADTWQMTIPAQIVSASGRPLAACTLDPNMMATGGGSLVVEARRDQPALAYQVHWSGVHTAAAHAKDCGATADLMVTRTDLQRLANAAGGFGVGDKAVVR